MNPLQYYASAFLKLNESVQYDEFTIDEEDGWVHVLDGEDAIRLSLPKSTFDNLIKKYQQK